MPSPPTGGKWTVNFSTSTITFLAPLVAGDRVSIDVLVPNEALGPGDVFNWLLKPLVGIDGVKVTFTLEMAAAGGPNVTVNRNEELLVSVDGVIQQPSTSYTSIGDQITFMQAPGADSSVFIVWMRSDGGTGLAGTTSDTADEILAKLILVDGAGSLLDADFLDGHDSTYFAADSDMTGAENRLYSIEAEQTTQNNRLSSVETTNFNQDNAINGKASINSPTFTGDPKAPTPTVGDNDTSIATTAFVTGAMASAVPAGTTIMFASSTVPLGYLKANGALVSRTTYAALFAAIGVSFGAGDGSTTFKLPDFRGEFLRGWDDARGIDVGRAMGSAQAANIESHTHVATTADHTHTWSANTGGRSAVHSHTMTATGTPGGGGAMTYLTTGPVTNTIGMSNETADHYHGVSGTTSGRTGTHTHAMTVDTNGTGTDTRPRNIALLACIKY
jgi:microcystin-dependent protein